jgi:hypothetical protein
MTSNEDTFDAVFKDKGGRLKPELLPARERQAHLSFLSWARSIVADAQSACTVPPPIFIDIVNNDAVNAWALREQGTYFIGLYSGAIAVLDLLFYRVLADANLLKGVGDASRERSDLPQLQLLEPDSLRMVEFGAVNLTPHDAVRESHASLLQHLALEFLVIHELCHVTNGHVGLLADTGSGPIGEAGWVPAGDKAPVFRLAIEWDADACAANIALARFFEDIQHPKSRLLPRGLYLRDPAQALSTWAFAVSALFRVFGDCPFGNIDLPNIGALPDRFRQVMAMFSAIDYAHRAGDAVLRERARHVVLDAVREVEYTFHVLTGESYTVSGLNEAFGEPGQAYYAQLEQYWKDELRARLVPHAFTRLAD